MNRIFPRNLTARAAMQIAGNPVTTRLESGVSNCFPGLEFDHRNLDRRFFPGLVFEFVSTNQERLGARLIEVQSNDPDLLTPGPEVAPADRPDENIRQALASLLAGNTGRRIGDGTWFLNAITQRGNTIRLDGTNAGDRLDGITVWRLVRSLERGPVSIELVRRDRGVAQAGPVTLNGWRRVFTQANTGAINTVYSAGELTQSLCSPWMHDFRDCACFYWASNHPDIVLAEDRPGDTLPDGSPADPVIAGTPVDWLRSDRSPDRTAAALGTEQQNRAAQMDHYQINQSWQDLSIVLLGQETSRVFQPRDIETATPFAGPDELAQNLKSLAGLEHAVMLEYLYARYSVLNPADATPQPLRDDVTFIRHEMLLIAVSEMRHLRWVNQLLWELEHNNLIPAKIGPVLDVAQKVPGKSGDRDRALRPLTAETLDDFIAVEQPSGTLDGQYARVLTTLRDKRTYPEALSELAASIIGDGTQHFSRFRQIRVVLQPYFARNSTAYLVNLTPASKTDSTSKSALDEYAKILAELRAAYEKGDAEDFQHIAVARTTMFALEAAGNALAARALGIPFF
jgi:Ferritin-like